MEKCLLATADRLENFDKNGGSARASLSFAVYLIILGTAFGTAHLAGWE